MAVTPRDQLDEIEDTLKAALTGMPDAPPLQDLIATITGMVEPSLAAGDIGAVVKALRLRTLAGVFHLGFDIDRGRNAARLSRACALLNWSSISLQAGTTRGSDASKPRPLHCAGQFLIAIIRTARLRV